MPINFGARAHMCVFAGAQNDELSCIQLVLPRIFGELRDVSIVAARVRESGNSEVDVGTGVTMTRTVRKSGAEMRGTARRSGGEKPSSWKPRPTFIPMELS